MIIKYHFFNKNGGVSKEKKYQNLNCKPKSGDNLINIQKNQEIVKKFFDNSNYQQLNLFFTDQIHSDKIFIIESEKDLEKHPKADGIVTNLKNIILGISTADCTPILFYDKKRKVIGACHAGWKGAYSDLIKNLIDIMINKYSCDTQNIKVSIGPNIKQSSYQVQKDFYKKWIKNSCDFDKFFNHKDNQYYFDLTGAAIHQLIKNNIQLNNIENINMDTFLNEDYFSYRRMIKENLIKSGDKEFGTNTSAIVIL
jgi:YfiH family protein